MKELIEAVAAHPYAALATATWLTAYTMATVGAFGEALARGVEKVVVSYHAALTARMQVERGDLK